MNVQCFRFIVIPAVLVTCWTGVNYQILGAEYAVSDQMILPPQIVTEKPVAVSFSTKARPFSEETIFSIHIFPQGLGDLDLLDIALTKSTRTPAESAWREVPRGGAAQLQAALPALRRPRGFQGNLYLHLRAAHGYFICDI